MPTRKDPEQFSGILPPADLLRQYDEIVPGSAQLIINGFQKQSEHRQAIEKRALEAQIADTRRGQIFGLVIGLAAIIGGSLTAILSSEWAGAFIGGGGVIGLVSVFVIGRTMIGKK